MHLTALSSPPAPFSDGLLSNVLDYAQDAVLVTDRVGRILYANLSAHKLFQVPEDDLLHRPIAQLFDQGRTEIPGVLRHAMLGGWSGSLSGYRVGESVRLLEATASPVRDGHQRLTGVSFMLRDVTARQQEQLEQQHRERTKAEFVTQMSHELRTPLTSILGFSGILGQELFGALNDKQAQYVEQIHRSGQHLLGLINDLLDFSKVEVGQLLLDLQPASVVSVCQGAIDSMSEQIRSKRLRLVQHLPTDLPEMLIDDARLKQILLNLLSNAVKFSEAGGNIGLEVNIQADTLELLVWDQGIGIPKEQQHRLFQPFQQFHPEYYHQGTGLGLALTKHLVELHGGQISVRSSSGEGCQFRIELPLSPAR
ncbi:MAG: PAS domain-containing sensor histidine kinase [Alkalinema sp. RU_4_3]|nr:PAS domain-containing sensor histidine kinase [Alkalinema sp. RU_4_3]